MLARSYGIISGEAMPGCYANSCHTGGLIARRSMSAAMHSKPLKTRPGGFGRFVRAADSLGHNRSRDICYISDDRIVASSACSGLRLPDLRV